MIKRNYIRFAKWFGSKGNKLIIDMSIAAAAGYFTLKKYLGFSLSGLLSGYLTPEGVHWGLTLPLCALVTYSVAGKIFLMIADVFPATRVRSTDPEGLNHCCLRINNEISRHIETIAAEPASAVNRFTTNHSFDVNVALVVQALADQMKSSLEGAARRDIFISVYAIPSLGDSMRIANALEYVTHYPPDRDLVRTRTISLEKDGPFRNYECVKCVHEQEDTRLDWACADYEKTPAKRHKTVKHYVGMKIKCNNRLLGFLNIELHNKNFFGSEVEMANYAESQLVAFRYLIEYQFLKKVFFHSVAMNLLK